MKNELPSTKQINNNSKVDGALLTKYKDTGLLGGIPHREKADKAHNTTHHSHKGLLDVKT
jgi:hypothetical protein